MNSLQARLLIWVCGAMLLTGCPSKPPESGRVFQTSYGRVLCAEMWSQACGVALSHCHDANEYRCLQNVRFETAGGGTN